MSDNDGRLVYHPLCCSVLIATCAFLQLGCDKKPESIEYTGEALVWRGADSAAIECTTFRPEQYPVLCLQTSGVRGLLTDSAPPPEPEVPRGPVYPAYEFGLRGDVDLPRSQMPLSAFEQGQHYTAERYYGPKVQFSGTGRVAGLPTDNVAWLTVQRDYILLNSSKVVGLDDFEIKASQKRGGANSLYVTPLFDEMSEFVKRKKREHELLGQEHEPPVAVMFAEKHAPFELIHAVLYTLSQAGTTDFQFLLENDRQTKALHCAHFEDDRAEPSIPARWWRCYEEPRTDRASTELEFVDLGALGPVQYQGPGLIDPAEPDQGGRENIVVVGSHGFLVTLNGGVVPPAEGCERSDITVCRRDGQHDYAALHSLLRNNGLLWEGLTRERREAVGVDAFLVRPDDPDVTYQQMLTTTQLLTHPSPTTTFSDTDELFAASRSDEVEQKPLAARVAWAGPQPKREPLKPGPLEDVYGADGAPK